MTIAVAIICAVLGIVIGVLFARNGNSQREAAARQANVEMEKEVAVLRSQLATETAKNAELKGNAEKQLEMAKADAEKRIADERAAAAKTLADEKEANAKRLEITKQDLDRVHRASLEEQKARFDDISKRLVAEAKNATEEMLKQREKQISESGHATMEQLVNPLKETIAKMEKTMNDTTLQQTAANTSLKEVLQQSINSNKATKQTADDLIRAFKHDSKIQGDWGECVLEELLQSLGLQKGIHFETQSTLRDESGNVLRAEETGCMMRPDVIVHLDTKKDVIVDSKVSMKAFMDYVACEDVEQRKSLLKRHIESLKKHVDELAKKKYSTYVKAPRETVDFVIMFVPRSAALWTALSEEPSLWRDAMDRGVYIADEQTLFAALRIVKLTWRQVQQAQNQQKVFELANEVLKRVGMFVKNMEDIGNALGKAQDAYNKGMAKLDDKGASIVQSCRKLERLGAKQDSRNPLPPDVDAIEMQEIEEK